MNQWDEWVKILENNPKKSLRELATQFNKTHMWVYYLKTFYNASPEEKEKLKDTHAQYAYFYKIWKEKNPIPIPSGAISTPKTQNFFLPIPYMEIKHLKKIITFLGVENKHLIEENNLLKEDNLIKARSINQLINKNNELSEEVKNLRLHLKFLYLIFYFTLGIIIILIGEISLQCLR